MRQIILDTETTGLETSEGHKIIEIGAIEMVGRRKSGNTLHFYFNPEREIDEAAVEVHGITNEKLANEPYFRDKADELLEFLKGAELIIHNAPFDVGFLNYEFTQAGYRSGGRPFKIEDYCQVLDTLKEARRERPGQKNNLDALCRHYRVDNSQRIVHGALLDAEILADVYLAMTRGQTTLLPGESENPGNQSAPRQNRAHTRIDPRQVASLSVVLANAQESAMHQEWLELLRSQNPAGAVWDQIEK